MSAQLCNQTTKCSENSTHNTSALQRTPDLLLEEYLLKFVHCPTTETEQAVVRVRELDKL